MFFSSLKSVNHKTTVWIIFLFALVLSGTGAIAQTISNGSIRGKVFDPSGAVVSGVAISAKSPNVAGTSFAVTDAEGYYRLTNLSPGTDYVLTAKLPGFATFERKGLDVRAGLNVSLDITLKVGGGGDVIEVTSGEIPLIETMSAEQAVNISGELVRALPLTGRREFTDTLQLTPGILSASTDNYGGQVYFVRGSENENHATLLDGADIGSFRQNWPSNFLSISTEALGDVQVKTGASDASSPSAMGMVINMSSPTGGDQFHGAVSLLLSPKGLNGDNTNGGNSASSDAIQPDFSFSGPIKKGKAWFFASGRYINRNDGISRTPLQVGQLKAVYPEFEPFDNESRGFVYLVNSTVQLSSQHKLFGLVQQDDRTQGGNGQQDAGNFSPNQYGGGAYVLRLTSNWSPNLTTRLLASYNNKGQNNNIDDIGGVGAKPQVNVYTAVNQSGGRLVGNTQIATLNNSSSRSLNPAHKSTFSGDLSYYIPKKFGAHEIQAGVYLQPRAATKSTTYYANNGFVLEDHVLNDPNNPAGGSVPFHRRYIDATALVTSHIGANDYAYYFQDRWRPFSNLTITAGLRADWISSQDWLFRVTTSHSWNYAPHIGGAFVLTKNQNHVLRASWGRVTDIPNASYFGDAGSNIAASRDEYDLDRDGTFETVFTTPASTRLAANKTIDPDRHQGYVQEWVVGYRGQLPGRYTLDISYIDRAYKDRPAQVDINQIYDGNVWAGLRDTSQNNIYFVTNNKWNWFVYRGFEFSASKQSEKLQFIASYTLAYDHIAGQWQPNDPASFIQPDAFPNNAGIGTVRGNTTNSLGGDTRNRMWQKHQGRTGITWKAPWQLRVSNSLSVQSGTPTGPVTTNIAAPDPQFGPTTLVIDGRLVSNPLATTTRFAYATRGEGQLWTPWLITWNARFGREFIFTDKSSVELALDVFNVINSGATQQFVSGGNQLNSTNYGGLQNIQTPRAAQFSARWRF